MHYIAKSIFNYFYKLLNSNFRLLPWPHVYSHLCINLSHKVSQLVNISWLTFICTIKTWKQLQFCSTSAKQQNRQCKMVLRDILCQDPYFIKIKQLQTSKLQLAFRLAGKQGTQHFMEGFPWLNSYIQALHHQAECKASDAVCFQEKCLKRSPSIVESLERSVQKVSPSGCSTFTLSGCRRS